MAVTGDLWVSFYLLEGDGREKLISKHEGSEHIPRIGEWIEFPEHGERLVQRISRRYSGKNSLSIEVTLC